MYGENSCLPKRPFYHEEIYQLVRDRNRSVVTPAKIECNRAILHTPFVPFNILFTHAIQYLDTTELDRLNYFAESLQPKELSIESPTHPYRLYSILCQAAKLHFDRDTAVSTNEPTIWSKDTSIAYPFSSSRVYEGSGIGIGAASGSQELRSWYYGNQQMMNLLNDNIFY